MSTFSQLKRGRERAPHWFTSCNHWVCKMVGDLEWTGRKHGEEVYGRVLKAGRRLWRCLETVWIPTRGHLCRGAYQDQVDQMTSSLRCLLSSTTPAPNKMAGYLLWGNTWLRNMEFLSLMPIWILSLMSFYPDNITVPWHGHHSLRGPFKYLCQVNYMKCLTSWEEQWFVFPKIDMYFGYGFDFLTYNASSSTNICGCLKCLICHHRTPSSWLLTEQPMSQHKTYSDGLMSTEFSGFNI